MTCYLNHAAATCALGPNISAIEKALFNGEVEPPLTVSEHYSPGRALPLGIINGPLPKIDKPLLNTRNNRILLAALNPLRPAIETLKLRYGSERIAVVIGSSTSGIAEAEKAVSHYETQKELPETFDYQQQEIGAPSEFLRQELNLDGPCWTISTACTSGAKALASAARLLELGACDAVIAGGGDSLCRLTVEGFSSLSAVSNNICNPFSANRNGINIGEGAALFIVSREKGPVKLTGVGETSDAHHISAPHPEGRGAISAMQQALKQAQLSAENIDYINLHGTATEHNDSMEAQAIDQVFGGDTPCSSTKPLTGHTLGAAGALEAAFCWLTLQRDDGALPPQLWDKVYDPKLPPLQQLGTQHIEALTQRVMSNSFAFGGNNISLIMERS